MKKNIKLRNSSIIGENIKPYFIAEMNTSHFGNMDIAKKMIEEGFLGWCGLC